MTKYHSNLSRYVDFCIFWVYWGLIARELSRSFWLHLTWSASSSCWFWEVGEGTVHREVEKIARRGSLTCASMIFSRFALWILEEFPLWFLLWWGGQAHRHIQGTGAKRRACDTCWTLCCQKIWLKGFQSNAKQTVPETHIILDLLVDLQCLFSGFYSSFFNVPYSVILSVLSYQFFSAKV